jgi:ATP-dependent exoDNAse (exonuclease V) alpha subunit
MQLFVEGDIVELTENADPFNGLFYGTAGVILDIIYEKNMALVSFISYPKEKIALISLTPFKEQNGQMKYILKHFDKIKYKQIIYKHAIYDKLENLLNE